MLVQKTRVRPTVRYIAEYRENYEEAGLDNRPGVAIEMLAQTIERAHSICPAKVALPPEGMIYDYLYGPARMRRDPRKQHYQRSGWYLSRLP